MPTHKQAQLLSLFLILSSTYTLAFAHRSHDKQFKTPSEAIKGTHRNVPNSWELSGVMAARNSKKSWTAQVHWVQQGSSSYQIRLNGPLGSGSVLIERQGGLVNFRDGPKSTTAKNADELLQRQTGVRLPVNNLYYWVRGIPAPGGSSSKKQGEDHQFSRFQQAGFSIEYPEYMRVGSTVLPRIIKIEGYGVSVKLVVKRWKAN